MYILSDCILCDKYLRLSDETAQWLKQQPDSKRAIAQLVTIIRQLEKYYLKRTVQEKTLLDEKQLYRLHEKTINQQKHLHNQKDKVGIYQQLQDEKDKLTEQLEISQEQVKTLQKQLQDQLNW